MLAQPASSTAPANKAQIGTDVFMTQTRQNI
jgi:hypothetical protein